MIPYLRRMANQSKKILLCGACCVANLCAAQNHPVPQTVYFPAADGTTTLAGYLYEPAQQMADQHPGAHPAVVMLHGRSGPYSSRISRSCTQVGPGVTSPCNAGTLSKRHKMWGEFWAAQGYAAPLVDSFGPRGRAHGYGRGTHADPDRMAVNELTVRPLDAEAALRYLAQRSDILPGRIMLQGWSNGASTTINTLIRQADKNEQPQFRAALAFYPGCGQRALLPKPWQVSAFVPLRVFLGSADEEVSPRICRTVLKLANDQEHQNVTQKISVVWYDGATHDFDDPGQPRQASQFNQAAKADAMQQAAVFLESVP